MSVRGCRPHALKMGEPGDDGVDSNDPVDSHWGMGNGRWPVRPEAVDRETLLAREGGVRNASN